MRASLLYGLLVLWKHAHASLRRTDSYQHIQATLRNRLPTLAKRTIIVSPSLPFPASGKAVAQTSTHACTVVGP
ncbi:hypothetical protein IQ06DRAFT_291627 [Phaeosphaeriaceae sp. SRC1lsM3a]|nr:hypothetical protein IQ06DRAFT_291627 [Stagonospora sp. SRC1lsM3a]